MRYLTTVSMKKSHKELAHIHVKRELGNIYNRLQREGNAIIFEFCESTRLPDNYMNVDVYVKFASEKHQAWHELTS